MRFMHATLNVTPALQTPLNRTGASHLPAINGFKGIEFP